MANFKTNLIRSTQYPLFLAVALALFSTALEQDDGKETEANLTFNDHKPLVSFSQDLMDLMELFVMKIDHIGDKMNITEMHYNALLLQVHSRLYTTTFSHRYDDDQDTNQLTKWAGPDANQELCLHQLEQLNARIERQYEEKGNGRDVNLYQLIDTYGWLPSGIFLGIDEWAGEYNECLRLKINSIDGPVSTRYCSAAFKRFDWPKEGRLNQLLAQKAGVCLPKSCDSTKYKNKFALIEKLAMFKSTKWDEGAFYLDYLYCLPDEKSTLRLWYYSPKAIALVGVISLWLALLLFATLRYRSFSRNNCPDYENNKVIRIYKSLSLVENLKSLFTTTPKKEVVEQKRNLVNLDVIEGIKVITTCYIITGHVIMNFAHIMNNMIEYNKMNLATLIFHTSSNLPALSVNIFFSLTGILTAYLLFKHSKPIKLVTQPSRWVAFVVIRYIRIMPLYLIVVMYEKYLAKYTGSGPFWDYGTSALGTRRQCEQESWFWTLAFAANFKGPLEHCIGSAWYLANDFQFFLVTPIFLALLDKRPRLGKLVTVGVIVTGWFALMVRIMTSGYDLRPVTKFMPHSLKTYLTFLVDTYSYPHYRLPAYLCGLLMGHALYSYEHEKLLELSDESNGDRKARQRKSVDWPDWMKKHSIKLWLFTIFSSLLLPFTDRILQSNKFYSTVLFGMTANYNLLFAITTGLYILLATTGHGNKTVNKFLASPLWKPFSRMALSVLLINIQVAEYLVRTSTHFLYFDLKIIVALFMLGISVSYLLATVLCVVFESPLRNLINIYLLGPYMKNADKEHDE